MQCQYKPAFKLIASKSGPQIQSEIYVANTLFIGHTV
jgi:hypothetical protein